MAERESHGKIAVEHARAGAVGAGSFLVGLVACVLPARWRRSLPVLESSPWREASIPSSLLQIVVCLALFTLSYVAWINRQYEAIDERSKQAAIDSNFKWDESEHQVLGRALLLGNPILPFVFAATTPHGFLLLLGFFAGGVRMLHGAITKDVMPDPVLGAIDWAVARAQGKVAHERREASKDRAPDRMILGAPGDPIVLVIETAADLDWREGNTVVVAGEMHRLVRHVELRTPAGLRQRYELEKMPVGIAIRGLRQYAPGHAPVIESASGSGG